jgi:hypothetical protein
MHNFGRYPRREIAMSYPAAGRIYRKQRCARRSTDITRPTLPLFATRYRFSQRAPPDNLPLFHYGFY